MGKQREPLKHVANGASERDGILQGDVASIHQDPSALGCHEPVHAAECRRLAAPGRSQEDHELPALHREGQVRQDAHIPVVTHAQLGKFDHEWRPLGGQLATLGQPPGPRSRKRRSGIVVEVPRVSRPFPERVGWYELLAPIGAGGMATVYLGVAERTGGFQRHVAVKMIHGTQDSDPHLAADLLREAKLAARIRHPNVVPVLDVGEDAFGLYLVMDYVEGDNLAGLRRAASRGGELVPVEIALRIVVDALAGLHAAHELKETSGKLIEVVHRDFSPQNILVGTDGIARLTDFGIAKIAMTAGHTRTGKIKGKIAYMAPEQARGKKVDRRCDVWAAGVVLWELLTGERLYDSEDEIGLLLQIVNEDPRRLRDVRPDFPLALDEALSRALTRDLDGRCSSAQELRNMLVASHPIADTATVAQFVRRIVGPKLAIRNEKIEELRRVRARGAASGEVSISLPEPLDQPDEQPAPRRDAADETLTRVRDDTTGATVAWQPSEISGDHTRTSGIGDSVERSVKWALSDPRRRAAFIGIASGLVLSFVVVVVLVASSASSKPPAGGTDAPATVAAKPAPKPPVPNPPTPVPPVVNPPLAVFVVKANADIKSLTIDGKPVPIVEAAREIEIDTLPEAGQRVDAVASDGRKTKAVIDSGAKSLELVFAAPRRPTIPKPPSTTKPGLPVPFATENPYKPNK